MGAARRSDRAQGVHPFYRRNEAALSVACALHARRDGVELSGVNGALTSRQRARELDGGLDALDLDRHAPSYMDTSLGGYGLFYAATLQDARLVTGGASGLVDRVTPEHGAAVAQAVAEIFEQTTYAREYLEGGSHVPARVLHELGEAVCLCTVPGRRDHELLLQTFFGEPLSSPAWEKRRRVRVESISLLLEFHDQRPAGASDDLAAWRRALVDQTFTDGTAWVTSHHERRESWRRLPAARDRRARADDGLKPPSRGARGPAASPTGRASQRDALLADRRAARL
jgi:hypothetical protein